MKNFTRYLLLSGLGLITQQMVAQPINDNVCNAIELPVDGSISNHTNALATIETDEVFAPATGCQSQDGWCGTNISNSMWFTFIAPTSGEVGVSTCFNGSFDTKIAVWDVGDCSDFSTFVLKGANDDTPGGCFDTAWASTLDLIGLTSGNTYYIQMDSYVLNYGNNYNIAVGEGSLLPPPPAFLKIINNSPDAAMNGIDVRVNGSFPDYYLDNLTFRYSSYVFQVPSGEDVSITINSSTSVDDSSPILSTTQSFVEGTNTIIVIDGISSTTGYSPDYLAKPLSFYRYDNAINYTFDYQTTNLLFHHGVTDAPAIDLNEIAPGQSILSDNLSYSDFDGYLPFTTNNGNLSIQVTDADSTIVIDTYVAPIQSNYWGGAGYTILASGFLDPTVNSNGPSFGLWYSPPYGGPLYPLSTSGDSEYDDACNAATLTTDGVGLNLSSAGLTTQSNEPVPPSGSCSGTLSWCDNGIQSTIWAKFTAPASGSVTLTTCNASNTFNTQLAVYSVGDCNDFSTYTLVGANDDQAIYCFESPYYGASTLPLCQLTAGQVYYVQIDGAYGAGGNFSLVATDGATCYAQVQFIHNSADLSAEIVDIRINGEFVEDQYGYEYGNDRAFRTATPFLNLPSGEDLYITINPSNSNDDSNPIKSFTHNFAPNTTNIAVIDGIASADGYDPDSTTRPIELYYYDQAINGYNYNDYYNAKLLFHNGVTDAGQIDIIKEGFGTIVDDLDYGDYNGYQTFETYSNFNINVMEGNGIDTIDTYVVPVQSNYWGGGAYTILASGFINQENNSNGPEFGLYAAYIYGGNLYPLPTLGDFEYDNACNAVELPTDGSTTNLSNLGLTTQANEPQPPAGFYYTFDGWGNNTLDQTIWGKFVAPSSGEVTITTCSPQTTFNTQIAVYTTTNCEDFSTYSLVAANEDEPFSYDSPQYCDYYYGSSFLPLCGLTAGQTYYVQIDKASIWDQSGNFGITVTEGATCFARLQLINNCADVLASNVDIRYSSDTINDVLMSDYFYTYDDNSEFYTPGKNLSYHEASNYFYVPADQLLTITVNPANSVNNDNAMYTVNMILDGNTSNILVMKGVISESGYIPDNIDAAFGLVKIENSRTVATNFANTDLIFFNGATDSYTMDINEPLTNAAPLVNNFNYNQVSDYVSLPTANEYQLNAVVNNTEITIVKANANLIAHGLYGQAVTVCLSGFQEPSANSNGPPLEFWFARSYNSFMTKLITNSDVCDAISIPNTGVAVDGSNIGATADASEVSPGYGGCDTAWCDVQVEASVWFKFVAPSAAVEVTTCYPNNSFDSQIAIWKVGACGDYSSYVLKGANDDSGCLSNPFAATAIGCGLDSGQTYYVQVDGKSGYIGDFKISVSPNGGNGCPTVIGIKENSLIGRLSIFPNPTNSGKLNINFETKTSGNIKIEILDVIGNKLQTIDLANRAAGAIAQTVDVSKLSSGLYFVNILHNNTITSSKIQVQN